MTQPLLHISNLKKSFAAPDGASHLIVDVPVFSLEAQKQSALAGESGSGKTTFLNLIAGILKPDTGTMLIDGTDMASLSEPKATPVSKMSCSGCPSGRARIAPLPANFSNASVWVSD